MSLCGECYVAVYPYPQTYRKGHRLKHLERLAGQVNERGMLARVFARLWGIVGAEVRGGSCDLSVGRQCYLLP